MSRPIDQLLAISIEETKALELLLELMQRRFGGKLSDIVLFGSKARTQSTPLSDIDILVVIEKPSALAVRDAGGLGFDVWAESGVFVTLHIVDRQYWESSASRESMFFRNVERDGISLLPSPT